VSEVKKIANKRFDSVIKRHGEQGEMGATTRICDRIGQFVIWMLLIETLMTIQPATAFDKKQYARAIRFKKCINCDLYKANFAGLDLTNADFSGSNLILATFQKATLYQARFDGANLTGANFRGALWIDGRICQENSYGKCLFSQQE